MVMKGNEWIFKVINGYLKVNYPGTENVSVIAHENASFLS